MPTLRYTAFIVLLGSCASPSPTTAPPAAAPLEDGGQSYDRRVRTALSLAESGKGAQATGVAEQATTLEPDRPEAYQVWGLALAQSGDLKQSAEKYEMARARGGRDRRLFAELASVYDVSQRYEDAVRVYRDYLAIDPSDADMRQELALTLLLLQRYEPAVRELETVAEKRPDDLQVRQDLGYAYLRAGEPKKAIATLESVLAAEANRPDAMLHLARAYAADGRAGGAITLCDRLLASRPEDETALRMRARLLLLVGNAPAAAKDYEALLRVAKPDDPAVLLGYAGVLIALDQLDRAEALVAKVRQTVADHPLVAFRAAQVGWRRGERSALKALADFARNNPTDVEAWRELNNAARRYKDSKLEKEAQAKLRALGDLT
jgi:tetratricopeptide (TPR) repeat protein